MTGCSGTMRWIGWPDGLARTGVRSGSTANGWENHPTLSEFAAGPADNGRELLCIYRASKINLQLMPAGFIHQRALDGLASGGFFLTRFIPQDVRGRVLRRLQARMSELNIDDPHALACCEDEHIRSLRHEFLRGWSERSLQDPVGLWGLDSDPRANSNSLTRSFRTTRRFCSTRRNGLRRWPTGSWPTKHSAVTGPRE